MQRFATVLKFAAAALATIVALAVVAGAIAQTGVAKRWLADTIAAALSDATDRVTLQGLHGSVPFRMTVDEIVIADAVGPRLTVSGGALDIAPLDLLAGRLTVRRLTVKKLALLRSGTGTGTGNGGILGFLLQPPLAMTLAEFRVDEIVLGADILGQPMRLAATADGSLARGRATGDLAIERRDAPGHLALHVALDGTPAVLHVDGTIVEPSGVALAHLLGQEAPLPLSVTLAGTGPLADWRGTLAARAGGDAALDMTLRLTRDETRHLAITGSARLAPLLPASDRALAGEDQSFALALALGDNGDIAVDHVAVTTAAGTLGGSGRYTHAGTTLAATAALTLPDLRSVAPLVDPKLAGAATLNLALSGTLSRPVLAVDATARDLAITDVAARTATATVSLHTDGDLRNPATPVILTGDGSLDGLTAVATPLPAGAAEWHADGRLDHSTGTLTLTAATLKDAGATLSAAGTFAADAVTGTLTLDVPSLAPLLGSPWRGALHLGADLSTGRDGTLAARLAGTLDHAGLSDPILDAAVGPHASLTATLRRLASGAVFARDIRIVGTGASLTADGDSNTDGRLAATGRLTIPHLAAIDPDLDGDVTVDMRLAGPAAALSGTLALTGTATASGHHLDQMALNATVTDLAALKGHVSGGFSLDGLDTALAADTAYSRDTLTISGITIAAGGSQITGDLSIAGKSGAVAGRLDGDLPDLKPWSPVAGMPLAGSLALHTILSPAPDRRLGLNLTLDGKAIHVDGVALETLHLIAATDRSGEIAVTADAHGTAGASFALATAATVTLGDGATGVAVTRLVGSLAGTPLALQRPLRLDITGGNGAVGPLDLSFGAGRLTGDGRAAGDAIALHLLARDLPVASLARLAGRRDVTGTLGAELTIGGSRDDPSGRLVVDGENLHFAATSRPDLAALGAMIAGDWQHGSVALKGRLAGPNHAAVGFTGTVPLLLDRDRLAFYVPGTGDLTLHLEGEGDLANLVDLLPLGEDKLSGQFTIDATVGGTVATPTAAGWLAVTRGHYESLDAGTVLDGVGFTLAGDRQRLVLADFAASDGDNGRLTLAGSVDLAATPGPALSFAATLARFHVSRLDEAGITASGDVRLGGTVAAPALAGRLRVDEADISIPDQAPLNARPVNAVVIDSRSKTVIPTISRASAPVLVAATLNADLDLPGRVFVRGRGLDSEWRGHLHIEGTSASPDITGRLDIVNGTYDFLGKSMSLDRGTFTFAGGSTRIDPLIDAEASSSTSDMTAIIDITGTATAPLISLSAQPALPRDEILARLLFGTSISQVTPVEGVQLAQAAASLANGGSPGVMARIRRGLGLDRLSLGATSTSPIPGSRGIGVPALDAQPGLPGSAPAVGTGTTPVAPGISANTGVSAGRYVAKGVYVGVTQGLTSGGSSVNVEVDVTRHLSVETQAGTPTAGSGLGIDWKYDY